MSPELLPSQENVKRAQSKFNQLKFLINGYIQSGPHRVRTETEAGMTYIIGRIETPLPEDVAWEAVEAVQRLRIALDKAMVALIDHNGFGVSGVGFPFGGIDKSTGKPDKFPTERMIGKHGIEKKLSVGQWDVIKAYKPYPGGNDTLWAINEIANDDKHRKDLVKTMACIASDRFSLSGADGTQSFISNPATVPILYDQECETVFLAFNGGTGNFKAKQSFAINVVFGEIFPVAGKNVLATLNQQIRMVENILKGMSNFF